MAGNNNTTKNIKDVMREEYLKCAKNPIYFMRKYVKIQHPTRGTLPFLTYPFQDKTLKELANNKKNIILKSRQMGITTLVAAYSLWLMTFHTDKDILCISITQETSKAIVTKVRFANDNLPSWLKVPATEDNRLSLRLKNGSLIRAASSAGTTGRSPSLSLLIIDEAAFIEGVEEIWLGAQPSLSCLDKTQLILTCHGLIRLEDLINYDTKLGFNNVQISVHDGKSIVPASSFYMSEKSDMFEIKFKSGGTLIATKNHPLMTRTGWKTTEELVVNSDEVLCKYNQRLFGNPINFSEFLPTIRVDSKRYSISSEDICYLVGLWVAEGHFSTRGIGITNTDDEITNWLKFIGFKNYDNRHYYIHSVWMVKLLKWVGCAGVAHTKRIPSKILSSSLKEQIAFLQGLFDGDGCSLKHKGIKLTSVSYELLSNVKTMLLNMGIFSYIKQAKWNSKKSTVIEDKSRIFIGYELYIGGWDAHLFYSTVGFRLTRKQNGRKFLPVKSIKRTYPDKNIIKDLILESGMSIRAFSKKYKCHLDRYLWFNGKGLSISSMERLLDASVALKSSDNYYKLKEQYHKDTSEFYDRIISISYIKNDVSYDIKVPSSEKFICNGYLNHNTGGSAIILSCVTADTYVFDSTVGLTQIKNYVDDEKIGPYEIKNYNVLGKDIFRSGTLFHNNGKVNTKIIKTKFSDLECSLNHKLWAYRSSTQKYGWVTAGELSAEDFVSVQRGINTWVNNDSINNFVPSTSNKIHSSFNPKKITPDLCYLLGLYISEGSVYKVKNAQGNFVGGTLTITCGDNISYIFDRLGLTYSTSDNLHYCISNKNLIEFFEYLGFDLSRKANQKIIPQRLMSISKKNMVCLLRGIFDGDGSGTANRVTLGVTSEELISQVRMILNNFGILCSRFLITKEKKNSYQGKIKHNFDTHCIEIYGRYALKFFNEIGFGVERKSLGINKILNNNLRRPCSHDIIPNSLELMKNLYHNSGENTSTIRDKYGLKINGVINKKTRYKTENVSADNVRIMYNNYKHTLSDDDQAYWDSVIDDKVVWCKIKSISDGESFTYDFSLPDNSTDTWCHSIIYNGIIGHQTPNGVGNFFHRMWTESEQGLNDVNRITLPWNLHPERDMSYREEQTKLLGEKGAAQECDCVFSTSGNTVIDIPILQWYEQNQCIEPIEKRGFDKGYWIYKYPEAGKAYMVSADVGRGDGRDFSGCHVLDIENLEQVAEYKGKIPTKDYARILMTIATEYNMGLLVVENANVGWAVIQEILDNNYPNLFYSGDDIQYVDAETQMTNKINRAEKNMVPGFITSNKSRPLIISKLESYFRNKEVIVRSKRLLDELNVFIWKQTGVTLKAEAMTGYNDDLVMAMAIGLWIRDVALRLRKEANSATREIISKIGSTSKDQIDKNVTSLIKSGAQNPWGVYHNPWQMHVGGPFSQSKPEDLTWLLK